MEVSCFMTLLFPLLLNLFILLFTIQRSLFLHHHQHLLRSILRSHKHHFLLSHKLNLRLFPQTILLANGPFNLYSPSPSLQAHTVSPLRLHCCNSTADATTILSFTPSTTSRRSLLLAIPLQLPTLARKVMISSMSAE